MPATTNLAKELDELLTQTVSRQTKNDPEPSPSPESDLEKDTEPDSVAGSEGTVQRVQSRVSLM